MEKKTIPSHGVDITNAAGALHLRANEQFYGALLSAMQERAYELGWHFRESHKQFDLPADVHKALAAVIWPARNAFMSPNLAVHHSQETVDVWADDAIQDGSSDTWVTVLLSGLADMGIHPVPLDHAEESPEEAYIEHDERKEESSADASTQSSKWSLKSLFDSNSFGWLVMLVATLVTFYQGIHHIESGGGVRHMELLLSLGSSSTSILLTLWLGLPVLWIVIAKKFTREMILLMSSFVLLPSSFAAWLLLNSPYMLLANLAVFLVCLAYVLVLTKLQSMVSSR